MTARARVSRALDTLGLLDRLLWLRLRAPRRTLTVLSYHRVGRSSEGGELAPDAVEVERSQLEQQLAIARRYATIVTGADLVRFRDGRPLPPNPLMITFGGGYTDQHDIALPVLRRAGVAATYFIATSFPDSGKLFWWDRAAVLLRRCVRRVVEVGYPARATLYPVRDPRAAIAAVCRMINATRELDFARLWDELERATGVTLDGREERRLAHCHVMGWDQIRALRDAGMEVESQSHRHLALGTLDPRAAVTDLVRSRNLLREVVGVEARCLAYPFGSEHRELAAQAGFAIGLTHATGPARLDRFDPLSVPRIAIDASRTGAAYKLALLG